MLQKNWKEDAMAETEVQTEPEVTEEVKPKQVVICIDPGHGGDSGRNKARNMMEFL